MKLRTLLEEMRETQRLLPDLIKAERRKNLDEKWEVRILRFVFVWLIPTILGAIFMILPSGKPLPDDIGPNLFMLFGFLFAISFLAGWASEYWFYRWDTLT